MKNLPAIGEETLLDVLGKRHGGVAVNGDVYLDNQQLIQLGLYSLLCLRLSSYTWGKM
jgi:hypothetical protein